MKIRVINKETSEEIVYDVISYNNNSITQMAGDAILITSFDDDWVITEYNEEVANTDTN